jgi:hypothetical protein
MKTVYDMSSGQIVESASTIEQTRRLDHDATATQLGLQPVVCESRPERGIPPELVLADLNAFLEKMS